MNEPRHHALELLVISVACAFLFAFTFAIVMHLSLPATDLAYGGSMLDGEVLSMILVMAPVSGLLIFPGVWLIFRHRKLRCCVPVFLGIVMAEVVIVTPIQPQFGFVGSFAAACLALIVCGFVCRERFGPGECPRCGYDLRGQRKEHGQDARATGCSECGWGREGTEGLKAHRRSSEAHNETEGVGR
jgi:hypothetical protein